MEQTFYEFFVNSIDEPDGDGSFYSPFANLQKALFIVEDLMAWYDLSIEPEIYLYLLSGDHFILRKNRVLIPRTAINLYST